MNSATPAFLCVAAGDEDVQRSALGQDSADKTKSPRWQCFTSQTYRHMTGTVAEVTGGRYMCDPGAGSNGTGEAR